MTSGDETFLVSIDLDDSQFDACCPNQELCIVRCPSCAHLMGFCIECVTLFPDLSVPRDSRPVALSDASRDRLPCGACGQPIPEFFFLAPPIRHGYLVGERELRERGFGHLLVARRGP